MLNVKQSYKSRIRGENPWAASALPSCDSSTLPGWISSRHWRSLLETHMGPPPHCFGKSGRDGIDSDHRIQMVTNLSCVIQPQTTVLTRRVDSHCFATTGFLIQCGYHLQGSGLQRAGKEEGTTGRSIRDLTEPALVCACFACSYSAQLWRKRMVSYLRLTLDGCTPLTFVKS